MIARTCQLLATLDAARTVKAQLAEDQELGTVKELDIPGLPEMGNEFPGQDEGCHERPMGERLADIVMATVGVVEFPISRFRQLREFPRNLGS